MDIKSYVYWIIIAWFFVLGGIYLYSRFIKHENVELEKVNTLTTQIPLEQITEMFAKIQKDAKRDIYWEMLRWYFFIKKTESWLLIHLEEELIAAWYNSVWLFENDDGEIVLSISKRERHDENSLHARNQEFYQLADKYSVVYDWMDVEP